jgi:hypothetical protein
MLKMVFNIGSTPADVEVDGGHQVTIGRCSTSAGSSCKHRFDIGRCLVMFTIHVYIGLNLRDACQRVLQVGLVLTPGFATNTGCGIAVGRIAEAESCSSIVVMRDDAGCGSMFVTMKDADACEAQTRGEPRGCKAVHCHHCCWACAAY